MIDYLEQESGQADALEEQRRRLAAALTSAAAAGESGGVAGPSGAEKMAQSDLDGGPGKTAESEPLPAEEGQTAEETLPLLEETARLDRVLDSAQGELEALEREARAAARRMAAGTADEKGLALWEEELGLEKREDLPPEGRRALVLAALDQMETCTPARLRAFVRRMLEGEVTLTEDFPNYALDIGVRVERFLVPSLRAVGAALRRSVPAHLDCRLAAETALNGQSGTSRVLHQSIHLAIFSEEEEGT